VHYEINVVDSINICQTNSIIEVFGGRKHKKALGGHFHPDSLGNYSGLPDPVAGCEECGIDREEKMGEKIKDRR